MIYPELEDLKCDDGISIKKDFYEHEKELDKIQNPDLKYLRNDDKIFPKKIFHEYEEDLDI